jgi:hypothetical protein
MIFKIILSYIFVAILFKYVTNPNKIVVENSEILRLHDRRTQMLKTHWQNFQSFICSSTIAKLSIPHRKFILKFGMDGKNLKISLAADSIQMLTECEKKLSSC